MSKSINNLYHLVHSTKESPYVPVSPFTTPESTFAPGSSSTKQYAPVGCSGVRISAFFLPQIISLDLISKKKSLKKDKINIVRFFSVFFYLIFLLNMKKYFPEQNYYNYLFLKFSFSLECARKFFLNKLIIVI